MTNPLKTILLHNQGAQLEVCEYAAHVISWKSKAGVERIFTSKQAIFEEPAAIRGGVPIIFPQFNERGPIQRHGFARNMNWSVLKKQDNQVVFELCSNAKTKLIWPYSFRALYTITLNENDVSFALTIKNIDNKPFYFTAALHSYFKINQLSNTYVKGLIDLQYWDNDGSPFDQSQLSKSDQLNFIDAIDRVYFKLQNPLEFNNGNELLNINHDGFDDCVIWNPGKKDAQAMKDFADTEFNEMLCIEAAQIAEPIELASGETWTGSQTISQLTS